MSKKLERQRRAFARLCDRLPDNLLAWSFSQRMEYHKLSKILGAAPSLDDETAKFAGSFTPDTALTYGIDGNKYRVL